MKRIGRSRVPLHHQLAIVVDNLVTLPHINYASIDVTATNFGHTPTAKYEYQIALQPGLDGAECSLYKFQSWSQLLVFYSQTMKGAKV